MSTTEQTKKYITTTKQSQNVKNYICTLKGDKYTSEHGQGFIAPVLTSNTSSGTIGGTGFAITTNAPNESTFWKCFDGALWTNNKNMWVSGMTNTTNKKWSQMSPAVTCDLIFYNSDPIVISKFITYSYGDNNEHIRGTWNVACATIYGSNYSGTMTSEQLYGNDSSIWTEVDSFEASVKHTMIQEIPVSGSTTYTYWKMHVTDVTSYQPNNSYYTLRPNKISIFGSGRFLIDTKYFIYSHKN